MREGEALGAQRRVRNGLGERDGAGDDYGRLVGVGRCERVQGRDPQAHEVRRRRDVRGVARAAGRVVVDAPRRQVSAQLAGEVAGADVVGGDDHDG